jgi:uncharacterized protein YbaR (Trm112 family)
MLRPRGFDDPARLYLRASDGDDGPMTDKDKELGGKQAPQPSRIDPRLLEILVCPRTKTTLEYDAQNQELISRAAKLAYPIRDGIPIMLPEEARPLEE